MKFKLRPLLALVFALAAGSVSAHQYTIIHHHLLKLVAPGISQGKEVVRARARVGILAMQMSTPGNHFPGPSFRAAEKVVELTRQGDHFFAKTEIQATEIPGMHSMGPAMVELTLDTADGGTLTLREEPFQVSDSHSTSTLEDYSRALTEARKDLNGCEDAEATTSVMVTFFRRGLPY